MNPYNAKEWRIYENANKEKRNARKRELYKIKKEKEGKNVRQYANKKLGNINF